MFEARHNKIFIYDDISKGESPLKTPNSKEKEGGLYSSSSSNDGN
jgi:hypothetical protein